MAELTFIARIENRYQRLSPNGKKIANYLQQNPLDAINLSISEIADITGTSKATVSRFFRTLGYASHQEAKAELRTMRTTGYPLVLNAASKDYVAQELARIKQTWLQIKHKDIEQLAKRISAATKITLIGYRNSFPVALHFRQQLLQIRPNIKLLPHPGQSIGEELLDIKPDELVILVAFRRRPKIIRHLVDTLNTSQLVLMTDPSGQIYRDKVSQLIICQLGQELPLDSYSAPMSVISVLCNQVMEQSLSSSKQRIRQISNSYKDLDELE